MNYHRLAAVSTEGTLLDKVTTSMSFWYSKMFRLSNFGSIKIKLSLITLLSTLGLALAGEHNISHYLKVQIQKLFNRRVSPNFANVHACVSFMTLLNSIQIKMCAKLLIWIYKIIHSISCNIIALHYYMNRYSIFLSWLLTLNILETIRCIE